jgi:hypothetical protein
VAGGSIKEEEDFKTVEKMRKSLRQKKWAQLEFALLPSGKTF